MFAAGMLLFGAVSAVGQPLAGRPAVTVESDTLLLRNGRMYMRMTYRIRAAGIGVEEGLLLTPVLHAGGRECRFAPLLVNGRRRAGVMPARWRRTRSTPASERVRWLRPEEPERSQWHVPRTCLSRSGCAARSCSWKGSCAGVRIESGISHPCLCRRMQPEMPAERTEIYRSRYRLASPPSAVSR